MLTAATILGFDARKMDWKELKTLARVMLTQLGPVWVLCRNSSTARWNVFTALKQNTQKASFENMTDDQGRLTENTRWAMLLKGSSFAFLYPRKGIIIHGWKYYISGRPISIWFNARVDCLGTAQMTLITRKICRRETVSLNLKVTLTQGF